MTIKQLKDSITRREDKFIEQILGSPNSLGMS
jgi:hypothetical protein